MRSLLGLVGLALGVCIDVQSSPAGNLQPEDVSQAVDFKGLKYHVLPGSELQRNAFESLKAGHLPLQEVFTSEGLHAASNSAGCQKEEWRSRMSAVHDLVAHTYILTLPRKKKVEAAMQAAER